MTIQVPGFGSPLTIRPKTLAPHTRFCIYVRWPRGWRSEALQGTPVIMQVQIRKLEGSWDLGYALHKHTLSSVYLGDDEYGHLSSSPKFGQ